MNGAARKALADAASSVAGITVHPTYVQVTEQGSGNVRLDRIAYPNKFGGICYWDVVVLLPQDQATSEDFIETNLPPLLDALRPEMTVTDVQPQQMRFPGAGVLPCVVISGHREQE